jgi:cbb3-type cytochrome oxidase subunit 3
MSKFFSKTWDILELCFIAVMTIFLGFLGSFAWLFNRHDKEIYEE